jgi:P-type E1-E2 ATPase
LVSIPGQGISAVVKAQKYFVGSMTFMQNNNIECSEFLRQYQVNMDHSMVFMGCNKKIMGCVCIGDKLRDDAALVVAGLKKRSIHPIILSGDNKSTVRACAYKLGIEEFYSELTPQEKMQKVEQDCRGCSRKRQWNKTTSHKKIWIIT